MTDTAIHIRKTGISRNKREYTVYSDESKTEKKYLIREEKRNNLQTEIWHAEIREINPDATVRENAHFGRDSHYRTDDQGCHITIGPTDMECLLSARSTGTGFFGAWLAIALGFTGPIGVALARSLIDLLPMSSYLNTNQENGLDMFISHLNIALIPNNIAMPGPQPVVVRLGSSYKVLIF